MFSKCWFYYVLGYSIPQESKRKPCRWEPQCVIQTYPSQPGTLPRGWRAHGWPWGEGYRQHATKAVRYYCSCKSSFGTASHCLKLDASGIVQYNGLVTPLPRTGDTWHPARQHKSTCTFSWWNHGSSVWCSSVNLLPTSMVKAWESPQRSLWGGLWHPSLAVSGRTADRPIKKHPRLLG